MKALQYRATSAPPRLVEVENSTPGPGQVVLQMLGAGRSRSFVHSCCVAVVRAASEDCVNTVIADRLALHDLNSDAVQNGQH